MQQRRFRPGDVLDDYCPRERRITDHAIVAMIDDDIKQTRCVVCDAEHEYKDGKVPAQRRRKPQAALFNQVLEGLQGPQPAARLAPQPDIEAEPESGSANGGVAEPVAPAMPAQILADEEATFAASSPTAERARAEIPTPVVGDAFSDDPSAPRDDRPWRRQLIRAALPRPEGQQPQPTRQIPEFTVRQPNNNRGPRHGRRRGGARSPGGGTQGPMRFGRDTQGQPGQRQHIGRRRRRGKKQPS
jgi:hypothetical protein